MDSVFLSASVASLRHCVKLSLDSCGFAEIGGWLSRFRLYPCNPLIRVIRDSEKDHLSPRWGYHLHVGVTLVTLRRERHFLPKVLDSVRFC